MEMQSVSDCLNIIDDAIVEIYWYFKFRKKIKNTCEKKDNVISSKIGLLYQMCLVK